MNISTNEHNTMTNKEKFMLLVSDRPSGTVERNKERIKNRAMLRESRKIAYKVLVRLDVLDWSQKRLADEMGVSAQYISKIVQGKENLTLDTLIKLQNILDIPILASYNDDKQKNVETSVMSFQKNEVFAVTKQPATIFDYPSGQKLTTDQSANTYIYSKVS